jgi:hypothetical protein
VDSIVQASFTIFTGLLLWTALPAIEAYAQLLKHRFDAERKGPPKAGS